MIGNCKRTFLYLCDIFFIRHKFYWNIFLMVVPYFCISVTLLVFSLNRYLHGTIRNNLYKIISQYITVFLSSPLIKYMFTRLSIKSYIEFFFFFAKLLHIVIYLFTFPQRLRFIILFLSHRKHCTHFTLINGLYPLRIARKCTISFFFYFRTSFSRRSSIFLVTSCRFGIELWIV